MLRRNLLIYGLGGHHRPVHRHQAHRPAHPVHPRDLADAPAQPGSASTSPRCGRCSCSPSCTGIVYPLVMTAVAQLPGLQTRPTARWSRVDGKTVGSALIGQAFTDDDGNPLTQYFQSRPSAAGDGYDPTATAASNLGPESVVDTLPDPATDGSDDNGKQSLLTQVCARSAARRRAGRRGRLPAVLHRRRRRRGPRGVPPRRAHRAGHPVVSLNQACPATPFLADLPGRDGASAPSSARTTRAGVVTPDPRRRARPTRPCPPTRSPPAAAGSTRTSARPTRDCRRRGWPRPAASPSTPVLQAGRRAHHRSGARLHGRAGGERARAQPRPRPAAPVPRMTPSRPRAERSSR